MDHVAIDLGSKQSHFCIREPDGTIREEGAVKTKELGKFFALRLREKSRIIVETCSESFAVGDAAIAAGHDIRIVRSTLAPSLGVGEHGVKTDKRDARALSKASCRMELESVHIPAQSSREAKALLNSRQTLVEARTKLINTVRGTLRGQVLTPGKGVATTFPTRTRAALAEEPVLLRVVEPLLKAVEALTTQIAELDAQVETKAKADPVVQNLMTCPGVGPITALAFRATIDTVSRFKEAHAVQSYLGLTPGEDSSSTRQRRTSITKAGSGSMRRTLVQAAWCNLKKPKAGKAPQKPLSDMQLWANAVAERRGRPKAAVALARKMAGILFAMWRDNKPYARSMKKD